MIDTIQQVLSTDIFKATARQTAPTCSAVLRAAEGTAV